MYPGLTNTRVELRKIVRSSCFMILRIHFITTRKIQEIAFQGFQISKFPRGAYPRTPLDGSRLRRKIVPPQLQCPRAATDAPFNYSACRRRGGVLNSPRFCFYFFRCCNSQVDAALVGDTAGTSRVSRPKHGV